MRAVRLAVVTAALLAAGAARAETATAIFAGGCFWCVESDFDDTPGVLETISGYIGGTAETATYKQVGHVESDHREAVKITYDTDVTSYEKLLWVFWHSIDPIDGEGQFCDKGSSYRTAIFTATPEETALARATRSAVEQELGTPVSTEIVEGKTFYPAEDYHQDFHIQNAAHYTYYRFACGRNARVEQIWGDKAYLGTRANPD